MTQYYMDKYGIIHIPKSTIEEYSASILETLMLANSKEDSEFLMSLIKKNIEDYYKKNLSALEILTEIQSKMEKK